jgi:hypothetical protein
LQTGSPLFCVDLFEDVNLHGLVGHQPLQPRVLFFQGSEPLGFADFHPSELSLLRMVSGRADVMRRADRLDRASGLGLSQYPDDLFFAESTSLHVLLLLLSRTSVMSRLPFVLQVNLAETGTAGSL